MNERTRTNAHIMIVLSLLFIMNLIPIHLFVSNGKNNKNKKKMDVFITTATDCAI